MTSKAEALLRGPSERLLRVGFGEQGEWAWLGLRGKRLLLQWGLLPIEEPATPLAPGALWLGCGLDLHGEVLRFIESSETRCSRAWASGASSSAR